MAISTAERKKRVSELRETHEAYFQTEGKVNALYIPKMAYRPSGKDELHVSYFPSELEKEEDIYTEFVSIDYLAEDSKRTLYLVKHNPHWKSEYELVTSNSGFQRHLIPVSELKVVKDVTDENNIVDKPSIKKVKIIGKAVDVFNIADPEATPSSDLIDKLEEINQTLITLTKVINKFNK
tara:strand:+ start:7135 stop:7674 length:540 start_codon:yes stop_codon:yes gene_type:complete